MKALVIDDEEDVRNMVVLSLGRVGGMEVAEAGGGEEGVELARTFQPDVILLDVMMPGMDGPATLHRLRENEATRSIPVMFLTAKALTSDVQRLSQLGAAAVIVKPFNPMTLPGEVLDVLDLIEPD